jgi:hypothetical protein
MGDRDQRVGGVGILGQWVIEMLRLGRFFIWEGEGIRVGKTVLMEMIG